MKKSRLELFVLEHIQTGGRVSVFKVDSDAGCILIWADKIGWLWADIDDFAPMVNTWVATDAMVENCGERVQEPETFQEHFPPFSGATGNPTAFG